MTRLAGIPSLYALIAALLLATPLSASEDPVTEPAPPPEAIEQPQDAVAESTEPAPTVPEAASPERPPVEVTPQPEPAPVPPPSPEPAVSATEAQEQPVKRKREPRRSTQAPRATAAADAGVTISDFQFAPASVTIDVGDTVTWTNEGPTPHSATADDRSFDTGIFEAGESRSHTFDEAGTFAYFCTPHPNMRGTVTVRAASAGGGSGGGGGDGGGGSGTTGTDSGTSGTGSGSSGAGSGTSGDSSGTALPATGLDTGGFALLGLMTLALGAFLRRRAAAAE
jgi:LPXTG-motif cell wall-anchored protein